jgi:hypothetical protein
MRETVKVSEIHGMLGPREQPRRPGEFFEVKMTKFQAGLRVGSQHSCAHIAALTVKTPRGMAGRVS